jgi:hypothetical protein
LREQIDPNPHTFGEGAGFFLDEIQRVTNGIQHGEQIGTFLGDGIALQ